MFEHDTQAGQKQAGYPAPLDSVSNGFGTVDSETEFRTGSRSVMGPPSVPVPRVPAPENSLELNFDLTFSRSLDFNFGDCLGTDDIDWSTDMLQALPQPEAVQETPHTPASEGSSSSASAAFMNPVTPCTPFGREYPFATLFEEEIGPTGTMLRTTKMGTTTSSTTTMGIPGMPMTTGCSAPSAAWSLSSSPEVDLSPSAGRTGGALASRESDTLLFPSASSDEDTLAAITGFAAAPAAPFVDEPQLMGTGIEEGAAGAETDANFAFSSHTHTTTTHTTPTHTTPTPTPSSSIIINQDLASASPSSSPVSSLLPPLSASFCSPIEQSRPSTAIHINSHNHNIHNNHNTLLTSPSQSYTSSHTHTHSHSPTHTLSSVSPFNPHHTSRPHTAPHISPNSSYTPHPTNQLINPHTTDAPQPVPSHTELANLPNVTRTPLFTIPSAAVATSSGSVQHGFTPSYPPPVVQSQRPQTSSAATQTWRSNPPPRVTPALSFVPPPPSFPYTVRTDSVSRGDTDARPFSEVPNPSSSQSTILGSPVSSSPFETDDFFSYTIDSSAQRPSTAHFDTRGSSSYRPQTAPAPVFQRRRSSLRGLRTSPAIPTSFGARPVTAPTYSAHRRRSSMAGFSMQQQPPSRPTEPILKMGEKPAPKPSMSYAALIGEAILLSPPPHQLYVSEISESIKSRYAYYRQNPSKIYNGVRHQTSMCEAFVKLERPFGDQSGGARKWAIRDGCQDWFRGGGYHPQLKGKGSKGRGYGNGTIHRQANNKCKEMAVGRYKVGTPPGSPNEKSGGPSVGIPWNPTTTPHPYTTDPPPFLRPTISVQYDTDFSGPQVEEAAAPQAALSQPIYNSIQHQSAQAQSTGYAQNYGTHNTHSPSHRAPPPPYNQYAYNVAYNAPANAPVWTQGPYFSGIMGQDQQAHYANTGNTVLWRNGVEGMSNTAAAGAPQTSSPTMFNVRHASEDGRGANHAQPSTPTRNEYRLSTQQDYFGSSPLSDDDRE